MTITRNPDEISTPYSPIYFDVSSDLGTISSMIADVYVNTVLVATIDKTPLLGYTDTFRFEVGEILKKHFALDLDTSITAIELVGAGSSANNYKLRFFEVSDNTITLDTSWSESGAGTNYLESSTYYTFDGVIHYGQDINDYIATDDTSLFLSNRPFSTTLNTINASSIVSGIPFELGILATFSGKVTYKYYDSAGSLLSTNNTSIVAPVNDKLIFKHTGAFDTGTAYLTVQFFLHPSTEKTALHVYKVTEPCSYNVICWKNQYGNYERFAFEGNFRKSASSNSDTYEKRLEWGYAETDRGVAVRSVQNREEFEVFTKTENRYTINWLHEIAQSTDVYYYNHLATSNRYIPIIVKSVSSQSTNEERPVLQFDLNFEYANPKQSQIG